MRLAWMYWPLWWVGLSGCKAANTCQGPVGHLQQAWDSSPKHCRLTTTHPPKPTCAHTCQDYVWVSDWSSRALPASHAPCPALPRGGHHVGTDVLALVVGLGVPAACLLWALLAQTREHMSRHFAASWSLEKQPQIMSPTMTQPPQTKRPWHRQPIHSHSPTHMHLSQVAIAACSVHMPGCCQRVQRRAGCSCQQPILEDNPKTCSPAGWPELVDKQPHDRICKVEPELTQANIFLLPPWLHDTCAQTHLPAALSWHGKAKVLQYHLLSRGSVGHRPQTLSHQPAPTCLKTALVYMGRCQSKINRPALPHQPEVYLEPKWLR